MTLPIFIFIIFALVVERTSADDQPNALLAVGGTTDLDYVDTSYLYNPLVIVIEKSLFYP